MTTDMTFKESYKEQDGCHNCTHLYCISNFDDNDQYFCTNGGGLRPRSGAYTQDNKESFVLDENGEQVSDAEVMRRFEEWDLWSKGREVQSFGICGLYNKRGA
jgi:hypothetical protein